MKFRLAYALVLSAAGLTTGCSSEQQLSAFSSDGCSLFPDSSIITDADWCSCCFVHDIAYWKGGTEAERQIRTQQWGNHHRADNYCNVVLNQADCSNHCRQKHQHNKVKINSGI